MFQAALLIVSANSEHFRPARATADLSVAHGIIATSPRNTRSEKVDR
jgi:hypothetical protein